MQRLALNFSIFLILIHAQSLSAQDFKIAVGVPKTSTVSGPESQIQIYNSPARSDPLEAAKDFKKFDARKPILYSDPALNQSNLKIHKEKKSLGGTNGAGGGGGVACLKDPTKPIGLDNIKDLYTYDYWEWNLIKSPKLGLDFIQPLRGESVESYLDRILKINSQLRSTRFAQVLEETIREVLQQLRNNSDELLFETTIYTNDRGYLFENEEEFVQEQGCVLVQLAWRSPLIDADGKKYLIRFDKRMFESLGLSNPDHNFSTKIMNQASLILHEALYLIGERLGHHPNSYHVRFMVNYLMYGSFANRLHPLKLRYSLYGYGFDHFYSLVKPKGPHQNKGSRRQAYQDLVTQFGNLRRVLYPVLAKNTIFDSQFVRNPFFPLRSSMVYMRDDIFDPNFNLPTARAMSDLVFEKIIPSLSEDEALLLLGRMYADELEARVGRTQVNFESLLIDDEDDLITIQHICGQSKTYDPYISLNRQFVSVLRDKAGSLCFLARN